MKIGFMNTADTRRQKILKSIAKATDYEVYIPHISGFYKFNAIMHKDKFLKSTFSKKENNLENDLLYLERGGMISFSQDDGMQDSVGGMIKCLDPKKWSVGLKQKGCDKAKELSKSFILGVIKQEPVAFLTLLFLALKPFAPFVESILIFLLTFFL